MPREKDDACPAICFRSSPRKRGPRNVKGRVWIPAYAGMSGGQSRTLVPDAGIAEDRGVLYKVAKIA